MMSVQYGSCRQDPHSVTKIMVVRFPETCNSVISDEVSVHRMDSWLGMIPTRLHRNDRFVMIRFE